ncbi:MAG: hypothetical protein UU09_C0022G0001 [Microgenomates group bacterium GW2011_GWA2_40_6]|nr:MAG: hypothetical protein UU09_C0022G0001 [Microgenomates group bacterium GW2011_GWA2_40_6]
MLARLIKNKLLILVLFSLIGLILRLIYFDRITFGYDQARDALAALGIWKGDPIKIMGPTTDIKGLFHGPLYWYLISPFYYFFNKDPAAPRIFLILINLINIIFIYLFSKKIFKNSSVALIASFIFAVSYEATQYARWLSNPVLALLTIALFYYGLWLVFENKNIGFPLMLVSWAASVQFQFFLIYLLVFVIPVFIYLCYKDRRKIFIFKKEQIILYPLTIFLLLSFILAEIKFKFQGFKALLKFFQPVKDSPPVFRLDFNRLIDKLIINIGNTFTSQNQTTAFIILLLIVVFTVYAWYKKDALKKQIGFLFIWFISPILIYPIEKNNSYFLNIGNIYPMIMLISLMIYRAANPIKKAKNFLIFFVLGLIFLANLKLILKHNQNGEVLFSIQKNMHLNEEKKIIDYIYMHNNSRFCVNTVTNPLFITTTWSYLFDWYARGKFGFMPIWCGYPQDGVYGSDIRYLPMEDRINKNLYLIIEPIEGIPLEYIKAYVKFENLRSKLIERKQFGTFVVEKRLITNDRYFSRDDVFDIIFNRL